VLFGDLVGFTTLSEARDAEEVRELLSRYFEVARTVVGRYGGTIEKFIGDAVMAVWGVPVAHEDDAERAVRAGLDLVEALGALGEQVGAPALTMRVGVVTGEVAVTLGATGEGMVAGDAVNTASRIQAAAAPGEVWVDETTRALTMAAVTFVDAGVHELKGKAEPVALFAARQIVAARGGAQRVDGLEAPYTGHERELRLIKELFHATEEERRARLVLIIGGAGVGKSRIAWEFEKYIDGLTTSVRWHRGRCLAYGEGVAFWAFAEMVRGRLGVLEGDPPATVLERLDAALAEHVLEPEERDWLRPRLATLLDLGELAAPGATFARADLFGAWRVFLERLSGGDRIVALVFEDLQWGDEGLFDFVEYLLESARFPLFVVALARPEVSDIRPQLATGRRSTPVYLEPLNDEHMARLVDGLVGGLPPDVRAALVERSEGVPLYAVETVRALIDRDEVVPRDGRYVLAGATLDVASLGAPATLHALIASRLDALPPQERRAVQDAAVLGQSFTRDGLEALCEGSTDVDEVLASLVRKEVLSVEVDPRSPERGQFRWVQGLVRTVAYETLAKRDRKARHLAAAAYYEREAEGDELAGVIAAHYLAAIDSAPSDPDAEQLRGHAVRLLEHAARRAQLLTSYAESLRYYDSALSLATADEDIARLSEGAAETALLIARLDEALQHALDARAAYDRLGDPVQAGISLARGAEAWIAMGEAPRALAEAQPVLAALDDRPGAERAVLALALAVGSGLRALARSEESLRYYERCIELAEAYADWPRLIRVLNSYGGAIASAGRPVSGLALMKAALDLARREGIVAGELMPLNNLTAMQLYRDLPAALAAGAEGLAASRRLGETANEIWIAINYGFALWLAGRWDELAALHDELSHDAIPAVQRRSVYAGLAVMLAARGQLDRLVTDDLAPVTDDVLEQAFGQLLEATAAMAAGRAAEWADAGIRGTDLIHSATGIDDDFALFWPLGVEGALAANRLDEAARLIAYVASAPPGHVPHYLAAQLKRLEALLAIAEGHGEHADEALAVAAEELRRFGAPFWSARASLERGQWLHDSGRAAEAVPLFVEALRVFTELGAQPWRERLPAHVVSVAQERSPTT
jgi:class 3 adenylate cyclase/tetratricopeptide (TPR) repeat protein